MRAIKKPKINVPEPVGFECPHCQSVNCTTSLEAGQSIECHACTVPLVAPEATLERIRLGYELIDQFNAENEAKQPKKKNPNIGKPEGPMPEANEAKPIMKVDPESNQFIYQPVVRKVAQPTAQTKKTARLIYSSRWRRFFAAMIDGFLYFAVFIGSSILLSLFVEPGTEEISALGLAIFFALPLMFALINWVMIAMDGRTIGKYALGIKIVNEFGEPPGFLGGVIMRCWLPTALGIIPFFGLIDAFVIFTNDSARCIHDYMAATFVVDAKQPEIKRPKMPTPATAETQPAPQPVTATPVEAVEV